MNNPLEALTNLLYLVENSNTTEDARSLGRLAAQELARISEIVNQTLRFHRAPAKLHRARVRRAIRVFRTVAGSAALLARSGQAGIEEQLLAEQGRIGLRLDGVDDRRARLHGPRRRADPGARSSVAAGDAAACRQQRGKNPNFVSCHNK